MNPRIVNRVETPHSERHFCGRRAQDSVIVFFKGTKWLKKPIVARTEITAVKSCR